VALATGRSVARAARGAAVAAGANAQRIVGLPARELGQVREGLRSVAPSAQSFARRTGRAVLNYTQKGVLVTHSEYVKDVEGHAAGTGDYNVESFPINPGMKTTFRWLGGLANNYEKYVFKALKLTYRPIVGTDTKGVVIISPDFDPLDPPPPSKSHAMSAVHTVRSAAWENVVCNIPVDKLNIERFIRNKLVTGTDLKTYDIMNAHVATEGVTGKIGELYVEYTVLLHTPQMSIVSHGDIMRATAGLTVPDGLFGTDLQFYGAFTGDDFVHVNAGVIRVLKKGTWIMFFKHTGVNLTYTAGVLDPNGVASSPTVTLITGGVALDPDIAPTKAIGYTVFSCEAGDDVQLQMDAATTSVSEVIYSFIEASANPF
jgi:hypothetical protein